ncbi:hypothetical protein BCR36DRAFT_411829 [Piromyces finnis]|uniref:Transglutaminase-like domain-containing protein n=1 Tax=Piromyces finnis TaxID=1754191 RepID=A0A1Y1VAG9_9FUNG|nr:hypothetical protein BCR36DRAFT_411829 [Piromyces finnis]|eukprot:ORX51362.1 hypothetical protein BCR36DRAFT_411829 [Piromyces finnis]
MERVFGALSMDHPDIWWITKYRIHYKTGELDIKKSTIKDEESNNQVDQNIKKDSEKSSIESVKMKINIIENKQIINDTKSLSNPNKESIGRRIRYKRGEFDENSQYISKIQIQLCSSPLKNICNTYSVNDINRMNKLIDKKIQNILINAKTNIKLQKNNNNNNDKLSYIDNNEIYEYDFIKYIHNILIKNVQYGFSENGFTEYTIYGALVENRCVCEGFSEAFMVLAQRAKIYTILATSNAHQWNMVFLEGKWYALDITWDIPNYASYQTKELNKFTLSFNESEISTEKEDESFFLIGSNTIINEKTKMIFQNEPNHQFCQYVIYKYALGFRYPKLENNRYNPKSIYKKYIHIYY